MYTTYYLVYHRLIGSCRHGDVKIPNFRAELLIIMQGFQNLLSWTFITANLRQIQKVTELPIL